MSALDGGGLEAPDARQAKQTRGDVLLLVLLEERHQVLQRGQPREHADELKRPANAEPGDAVGRGARHVAALEGHAPAVGGQEAGDAVE